MFLRSISHALPEQSWTQTECWEAVRDSAAMQQLHPRSQGLLEKVLLGDSGIATRHFATDTLATLFDRSAEQLSTTFEKEAAALATTALQRAMEQGEIGSVDALIICTCTGYLCPGLTSHVAERAGLPDSTWLLDVTGSGCGAAIPALRAATQYLQAHPTHRAAVVAVEICSAAFYISNDPGVLISLCLFGDGAAAVILDGENVRRGNLRFSEFASLHIPTHREKIRFVNRDGKLCNQLHRSVPEIAAGAVEQLLQGSAPHSLISHGGGREVLNAIQQRLPQHPLAEAHAVLRDCGNLSSPSVLLALERSLNSAPDAPRLLVSFGAGFSAHRCMLAE